MDLGVNFAICLAMLFKQADFVKIVFPPTREPQSGGSGKSEDSHLSITVLHAI